MCTLTQRNHIPGWTHTRCNKLTPLDRNVRLVTLKRNTPHPRPSSLSRHPSGKHHHHRHPTPHVRLPHPDHTQSITTKSTHPATRHIHVCDRCCRECGLHRADPIVAELHVLRQLVVNTSCWSLNIFTPHLWGEWWGPTTAPSCRIGFDTFRHVRQCDKRSTIPCQCRAVSVWAEPMDNKHHTSYMPTTSPTPSTTHQPTPSDANPAHGVPP